MTPTLTPDTKEALRKTIRGLRARLVIDDIFTALAADGRTLRAAVAGALDFLLANARRAHPERDRKSGRLHAVRAAPSAKRLE